MEVSPDSLQMVSETPGQKDMQLSYLRQSDLSSSELFLAAAFNASWRSTWMAYRR